MRTRQALPYLAAVLLLAWLLGSLARSGTGGASILSNSYWLVYILYLLPLFALVAMIVMVVFLAVNWRFISDALGFGIAARKRRTRKQSSTIRLMVWITFWGLAVGVLSWRCGGIFCRPDNNETLTVTVTRVVENAPGPVLPSLAGLAGSMYALANIMGSPWFGIAFLGLLAVSTVIIARSIRVSLDETRSDSLLPANVREEGTVAVEEALQVLEMEEAADPRTRIMTCYGRMIRAAASLGAQVSVDQTARELETGIRRTFQLRGPGTRELTWLFEEARYSLHPITEQDSQRAQRALLEIREELKTTISAKN